ncbi:MAG: DUF1836 domain-containing protein [Eubacteriales bacterium]|nr:DUF1836 domain-containing protein [Eubacteriales bacterium]
MNTTYKDIAQLLERIENISFIKPDEFPDIPLYMDQVTSFIEEQLSPNKRNESDKVLTKMMINNYAKNQLFPSPDKKRYTKDHLIIFTIIYYFKNFLTINDIRTLVRDMQANADLTSLYTHMVETIQSCIPECRAKVKRRLEKIFSDNYTAEEALHVFVAELSYEIYLRKRLVETIIDYIDLKNESTSEQLE